MTKLLREVKHDVRFVKSHTLQPRWYKVLKVFILLAFLVGYYALFGILKTLVFVAVFILLSFVVHMIYRVKTERWTTSWLDFVVIEENGERRPERIGKFYYSAVVLNALLALVISQTCV